MNDWATPTIQVLMVVTGLILVVFVYRKVPGMFEAWLATKERLTKMHTDERDRERLWQTTRDKDDYTARHNDRNVLMVGQSELVQQIMAGYEKSLKIVADSVCRYGRTGMPREEIRGELGGKM